MTMNVLPKPFHYFRDVRIFLFALCLIISIFVGSIFYALYNRTTELLTARVQEQAVSYANLIRHTKNWNYHYQGVYVEKLPGVNSNRYLLKLGINPDIETRDGRVFTIRNHAIMVDEISNQTKLHDGISFRVVAMKPLSEKNQPDTTELKALNAFSTGAKNFSCFELSKSKESLYRHLIPLYVENDCIHCHRTQQYKPGEIIGAISITVPVSQLMHEIRSNRLLILVSAILTIGLMIGIINFLTWRLVIQLSEAQKSLKLLASTDDLTGVRNRRQIMQRFEEEFERAIRLKEPLCIIIIDIDHFKVINDTYGHPSGDKVLKKVSMQMSENLRSYDILGRIGGEEFLIVSPGSSVDDAVALAERLLATVRSTKFSEAGAEFSITISAGVASLLSSEKSVDDFIKRADIALYRAKQEGRDRVEVSA